MAYNIDFFNTYTLIAINEEIVPEASFFKNRYFPTGAEDIFAADKVLTEYQEGDRKLAPFVVPRVGDIPISRRGYEVREYEPPYIAPSRFLTLDDLKKRGFGEALYPGSSQAERVARIQLKDLNDLEKRIARREEWMCAHTMINNACTMQQYIDANTQGESVSMQFYDSVNGASYTRAAQWSTYALMMSDVDAMCNSLANRGLPVEDLVIGTAVAQAMMAFTQFQTLMDNRRFDMGEIKPQLRYPGATWMGRIRTPGGYELEVWSIRETYESDSGVTTLYFPTDSAMVTAPNCGHLMYGQITQIEYGSTEYSTFAATRVPKFIVKQENDTRKLRLASRPLAAPKTYSPWIYAADVV